MKEKEPIDHFNQFAELMALATVLSNMFEQILFFSHDGPTSFQGDTLVA